MASAPGWAAKLDPRAKLLAVLAFAAVTAALRSPLALALALALVALLTLASGLGGRRLLAGLALVLPVALGLALFLPWVTPGEAIWRSPLAWPALAASREGLALALLYSSRLAAAALATTWLAQTTSRLDLLAALRGLGLPLLLCQVVALTLRYLEVAAGEARRMQLASRARGFADGSFVWQLLSRRQTAYLVGMLCFRSLKRSERVYLAAAARGGFGASQAAFRLKAPDYWLGVSLLAGAALLILVERGLAGWIM